MLVTRFTDLDVFHCSVPFRLMHSPTVNVVGLPVSRQGDYNNLHFLPPVPCPMHAAPITIGSPTVFANGQGLGRFNDLITGCTFVDLPAQGTVWAGP